MFFADDNCSENQIAQIRKSKIFVLRQDFLHNIMSGDSILESQIKVEKILFKL